MDYGVTDTQIAALASRVAGVLLASAKDPSEIALGDNLEGIESFPAIQKSGGSSKHVRLPIMLLQKPATDAAAVALEAADSANEAAETALAAAERNGNLLADPAGSVAGGLHAFVPGANGSATGRLQQFDIPVIPEPNDSDVTAMYNIPTQAVVQCELRRNALSGVPRVSIHGEDTSGQTNPLTITAPMGLGSVIEHTLANGRPLFVPAMVEGVATLVPVEITAETDAEQSTISIPAAVYNFNIEYIARGGYINRSYWIDTSGVYHPFSAADTPLTNFSSNSNQTGTLTIGGTVVAKNQIAHITWGDDYLDQTGLPNRYCYYCMSLRSVDLRGLRHVETIGDMVFHACQIPAFDLSGLKKLRAIGANFNIYNWVRSVEIQIGSLDFSGISVGELIFGGTGYDRTVYANSQALVDAFIAAATASGSSSIWTGVVNETPVNP